MSSRVSPLPFDRLPVELGVDVGQPRRVERDRRWTPAAPGGLLQWADGQRDLDLLIRAQPEVDLAVGDGVALPAGCAGDGAFIAMIEGAAACWAGERRPGGL